MGRKRSVGNDRLGEHLQRRSGGTIELRFPIPHDVRFAFPGKSASSKKAFIKSLGTSDIRVANDRADPIRAELKARIQRARTVGADTGLPEFLRDLFRLEIRRAQSAVTEDGTTSFFNQMFAPDEDVFDTGATVHAHPSGGLAARLAVPMSASAKREWRHLENVLLGKALLSEDRARQEAAAGWAADFYFYDAIGRVPPRDSREYQRVLDECIRVLLDAAARRVELEQGRPLSEPRHPALVEKVVSADGNKATRDEGRLPISRYYREVYEPAWLASTKSPGERTVPEKAYAIQTFVELQGDKPIFEISNHDLWEFAEKLSRMPRTSDLGSGWRSKDAATILRAVDDGKNFGGVLNPKTVNKRLSGVTTLLKHAVKKRHVAMMVASDVKVDIVDDEEVGRPFDIAELNRIFSQPLFTGSLDGLEKQGYLKPGPVQIRDDRFWIPLVLLLSGARAAEIIGLDCDEVIIDGETPHFVLRYNDFRRVKNRTSRRLVPIHPYLIQWGFLDFARKQKCTPGRFFPLAQQQYFTDKRTGERKRKSLANANIIRNFNRTVLSQADAKNDRGSIKCFRNNFEIEAANKVPAEEENRLRLTGRSIPNSSRHYKPLSVRDPDQLDETLRGLYAAISKMTFDKVDFSGIK